VLNASAYVPDLMIIQMLNGFGEVHKSSDQTNYYWGWPHAGTDHLTVSYLATYIM
jgi:hypothetical protein